MILEDYINYLNDNNANGVVSLFTENCHFNDGGARTVDAPDLIADGKEELRESLKIVFKQYKVNADIVKLNPNSMEYDVILGDSKLSCIGCATLKNGLIDEYVVRPR